MSFSVRGSFDPTTAPVSWKVWHRIAGIACPQPSPGPTEDLMGAAVFLASGASNSANGQILYVDGGILAYIGKQP